MVVIASGVQAPNRLCINLEKDCNAGKGNLGGGRSGMTSRPMVLIDVFIMQVLTEKGYFKRLFIPSPHASPIRK